MAKSDGFSEMRDMLKAIGAKVQDKKVRDEALEKFAAPIVDEAKRLAGKGGGVMDHPTGNLADSIGTKKAEGLFTDSYIDIGWSEKGWYGVKLERGYNHYAKKKPRQFIKRPHLMPAYHSKKAVGASAAIEVLRKALETIK